MKTLLFALALLSVMLLVSCRPVIRCYRVGRLTKCIMIRPVEQPVCMIEPWMCKR